jgi:hypothetical protein
MPPTRRGKLTSAANVGELQALRSRLDLSFDTVRIGTPLKEYSIHLEESSDFPTLHLVLKTVPLRVIP